MVINCEKVASKIKDNVKQRVQVLKQSGITPKLVIVQVGNNPTSNAYVNGKVKDCKEIEIDYCVVKLNEDVSEEELIDIVKRHQKYCDVIIVQLPLPLHINEDEVIRAINPEKDVDGFRRDGYFDPCTPAGIMELLPDDLTGKNVLIINRSHTVGRPLVNMLLNRNATVTVAHSKTKPYQLSYLMYNFADIIITAVGRPKFVSGKNLWSGVTVIDVGINRDENNKLCGDLDTEDALCNYTPVPKGVGLLTRAKLMENVVKAAELRARSKE